MSAEHIQGLLALPDPKASQERTLSLLDDQFRTLNDLSDLDSALAEQRTKSEYLTSKLAQSQKKIDALVQQTRSSVTSHINSARELSLMRHTLADELSYLSQELVSSFSDEERKATLLEDIESLHRSLKELQTVKSYTQMVEHALKLSESSVEQVRATSLASPLTTANFSEYVALKEFSHNVNQACADAKVEAGQEKLQLLVFLDRIQSKTWNDIKNVLSTKLIAAAEKLHWPSTVDYSAAIPGDCQTFERIFVRLLETQSIKEKIQPPGPNEAREGLYPVQALIQPISWRFKYHFEGMRQTNRLDKPEWYFTHILNVAHEHRSFMEGTLQKILPAQYKHFNIWREFTWLLLALPTRKLKRSMSDLLSNPSLLAHTIYQSLAFDASLLEEGFSLSDTSAEWGKGESPWEGVSEVILGRQEWFEAWMNAEKNFAEDQYFEIISASDAWTIGDNDADDAPDVKTTNGARRIKALVEQVTDRYSPLPHYTHRTRFLTAVQLPLLEQFHSRILASLDAFETLSSAFVRAVPGALGVSLTGREEKRNSDPEELTGGVEGVQRLCKALISTKYVASAMGVWGEELFFLELWTEINRRPALRLRAEATSLLPELREVGGGSPDVTLFHEIITMYNKLALRAESMIVRHTVGEVQLGLKSLYATLTTAEKQTQVTNEIVLSQSLLAPISLFSAHLVFLRSCLTQTTVTHLYRQIAAQLSEYILEREILYRGHEKLSILEGRTILAACEIWIETSHIALGDSLNGGRQRVEAPWLKLLEASRIVASSGAPWIRLSDATHGPKNDKEWENDVRDIVGVCELSREEVRKVLRTRED